MALIAFFNYYYTFLQLEPKDLADSLKRQARKSLHLTLLYPMCIGIIKPNF